MSRGHGASRRRNYGPRQHDLRRRRAGRMSDVEWPRTWAAPSDLDEHASQARHDLPWEAMPHERDGGIEPPAAGASR